MEHKKARGIRFKAHPADTAKVYFGEDVADFQEDLAGLILNESIQGGALLVISDRKFIEGEFVVVKVGLLAPLRAEVRWVLHSEANIYKVGLLYAE